MNYKKINNINLGICHIIKTNSYGYMLYSEKNTEHFIVTKIILNNGFYINDYFKSLDKALAYFNSLENKEIGD